MHLFNGQSREPIGFGCVNEDDGSDAADALADSCSSARMMLSLAHTRR
jgi:hypothetical protein